MLSPRRRQRRTVLGVCFLGVWDANRGGRGREKRSDFEGEKKRRQQQGGIIGLGRRKLSGQLERSVAVDAVAVVSAPDWPCGKTCLFQQPFSNASL